MKVNKDSDNLILFLLSKWTFFVIGTILVAAFVFAGVSFLPKTYSSVSVIAINDNTARTAASIINTPRVLNELIAKFPELQGGSIDDKRQRLAARMAWTAPPGENRRTASLFYFSVEERDPALAQKVNAAALDAWLELTKPGPVARLRLEEQLERLERQVGDANVLIAKLESEAPTILAPNSLQGELATPLAGLRTRRDLLVEKIVEARQQLVGLPRDVIISPPNLSVAYVWPRRGIVTLIAVSVYLSLLLAYLIVHRHVRRLMASRVGNDLSPD